MVSNKEPSASRGTSTGSSDSSSHTWRYCTGADMSAPRSRVLRFEGACVASGSGPPVRGGASERQSVVAHARRPARTTHRLTFVSGSETELWSLEGTFEAHSWGLGVSKPRSGTSLTINTLGRGALYNARGSAPSRRTTRRQSALISDDRHSSNFAFSFDRSTLLLLLRTRHSTTSHRRTSSVLLLAPEQRTDV